MAIWEIIISSFLVIGMHLLLFELAWPGVLDDLLKRIKSWIWSVKKY